MSALVLPPLRNVPSRVPDALKWRLSLLQAQKLDEMLEKRGAHIDRVLNFVVPDPVLVRGCPLVPLVCDSAAGPRVRMWPWVL